MGLQRVGLDWVTNTHTHLILGCSCSSLILLHATLQEAQFPSTWGLNDSWVLVESFCFLAALTSTWIYHYHQFRLIMLCWCYRFSFFLGTKLCHHLELVLLLSYFSLNSSWNSVLLKQKLYWFLLPIFSLSNLLHSLCPGHLEIW